MEDWTKNNKRLCIECKYHTSLFGYHDCNHPINLDSVSGETMNSCWQMRHTGDLMFTKCTLGKLFEEKPREIKKIKWYKKLFNIVCDCEKNN